MVYFWFKSFHIIGVVVWLAGLFYLGRLFVYHREAEEKPEPARSILKTQYQVMEKRLYNMITTPGMVVTIGMAIALIITQPSILHEVWLQIKLILVSILIAYHCYCSLLLKQLADDKINLTSQQLRGLNEVPTILLFMIVLSAVFKNSLPIFTAIQVVVGFIIAMIIFFKLYGWQRRKMSQQNVY